MTVARDPTTNLPLSARIAELEAALAAERERREAAELILRGVINYTPHITQVEDAAADHFARYEKDGEG